MKTDHIDLLESWLDDSIGPDDLQRLTGLLKSDAEFRKEAVDALRMRGLAHAALGPDAACDRLADVVQIAIPSGRALDAAVMETIEARGLKPIKRAPRWARVAALVAAAWAVAITGWIILHTPPAVLVAASSDDATIERKGDTFAARPGTALHAGDVLRGWVSVRYEDGTTLDLSGELRIESQEIEPKRVRLQKGTLTADVQPQPAERAMTVASPVVETKVLGTAFRLSVGREAKLMVHHGKVAFGTAEVSAGQVATADKARVVVESATKEVLRKLGREHVMLGIMNGLGETYVTDTKAQGCRWDFRYQHLTPGWTTWNKDAGFPALYLDECKRLETIAVFTYYVLAKKPESKTYVADLETFFQKAGAHGATCILHVEPGASVASIGKTFGQLRDRHAPNVLLAAHVKNGETLPPGTWDLIFTDVADRDAALKGPWWKEKDFDDFRGWCAELHKQTGLPIMVWRIPLGNTYMATCNNTPWHYMDNRVEYWLENYPANRHVAEWSEAGVIGLLFGGGATECTVHKDNAKDGVTNPAPIEGNKGEKSTFPDDDGGYLRLRAGRYYQSGPHRLDRK